MDSATLTREGQLTVPKRIRDRLGLRPGDRIGFDVDEDGSIRLHVLRRRSVREVYEQLTGAQKYFPGHEVEREAARRHVSKRLEE